MSRDRDRTPDGGADADAPGAGDAGAGWRSPTRRAFVAMIGAAAAGLAAKGPVQRALTTVADEDRPRSTWTGKTRWIGHC